MAEAEQVRWEIQQLVKGSLFPDEDSVLRRAMRALFDERPDLRREMIARAYGAGEISLGKAAALLGISIEEAKEVVLEAGGELHFGPLSAEEARADAEHA
ncbi:MAG: hypothetical protein ACYC5O_20430 [Anaerolineae bacterium]